MSALRSSLERKNSPRGEGLSFVAAILVGAGLALASLPAQAAPGISTDKQSDKPAKEKMTAVAAKDPETTSSIQSGENEDANCARSRQRLFVEGEGWIVRRVTTCY
jgi:hypothetical protein